MLGPRGQSGASSSPSASRRQSARSAVNSDVKCDHGEVIDLSHRGIRLRSRKRWHEGQIRQVAITADGMRLALEAQCVWSRQEGMFTHLLGLAFVQPTDEQQRTLTSIAAIHALHEED
ncbi:MAG: PilZ domain-containing protein [Planctomycetota bacterium]